MAMVRVSQLLGSNINPNPNSNSALTLIMALMMICGVSPLRGFPVGSRVIGHLVPILGGRRLAGLVRVWGGACPSGGCPVDMAGQLVVPLTTPHGALGGRQASAGIGYGPASDVSASVQPSAGRTRGGVGGLIAIRHSSDAVQLAGVETVQRWQRAWC